MRRLFSTAVALGILLAPSAATYAASEGPSATPRRAVDHGMDFAKARALAPSMAPVLAPERRAPETDGLSRNDEDCNYGCIDH
jgi:hypothetical protein